MSTHTTRPAKRRTHPAPKRMPAQLVQEPAAEEAVLPNFLQGTLYGTRELSALLEHLNSPDTHLDKLSSLLKDLNDPDAQRSALHSWGDKYHRENTCMRTVVDALLDQGLTEETLELFNTAIGESRVLLRLVRLTTDGVAMVRPVFTGLTPAGTVFQLLLSKDPWRLKRCVECRRYFFDTSKNGRAKHCTARCKSRHTSRDHRRRTAHADQPA